MNGFSILFFGIFALVLVGTYISIRRKLLSTRAASALCAALSVSSLFAFGIAQELELLHTVAVALLVGLGFTGMIVLMAAFFQANQPPNPDTYLADNPPRE